MRWTSNGFLVYGRSAFTTSGPIEMLGTKCPSITSTWIQSAPAASTARTSSPSRAKSPARIEGAMTRGCRISSVPGERLSNEDGRRDTEPLSQGAGLPRVDLALASQYLADVGLRAKDVREIALTQIALLHEKSKHC